MPVSGLSSVLRVAWAGKTLYRGRDPEADQLFIQYLQSAAEATANEIGKHFGDDNALQSGPSGWKWRLMQHITEASEDPDVDVAKWMQGHTQLGIKSRMPP